MAQRKQRASNSQTTDWCYVFNDIPQDELGAREWTDGFVLVLREGVRRGALVHFCGQLERGDGGRFHFQLFLQYASKARGLSYIGFTPDEFRAHRPHYERRLGTAEQAEQYHSKEESRIAGPYRGGRLRVVRQGQRTDLEAVADRVLQGATAQAIVQQFPVQFIKYHGGIERSIKLSRTVKALDSAPDVRMVGRIF